MTRVVRTVYACSLHAADLPGLAVRALEILENRELLPSEAERCGFNHDPLPKPAASQLLRWRIM